MEDHGHILAAHAIHPHWFGILPSGISMEIAPFPAMGIPAMHNVWGQLQRSIIFANWHAKDPSGWLEAKFSIELGGLKGLSGVIGLYSLRAFQRCLYFFLRPSIRKLAGGISAPPPPVGRVWRRTPVGRGLKRPACSVLEAG